MNVNDNDYAPVPPPTADPHGRAALLLVESLIHGLVARSVLSVPDAVEVIDVAAAVKAETGAELGDTPDALARSLTLLQVIRESLARDI